MPVHHAPSPEECADLLRSRGLRVTSGRVAAITYLSVHPHSSATEIHTALAAELASVSQQSVHNIVQDLTECGILRRIDLPDSGSSRYEAELSDNHHHIQCVACHRIEDVECTVGLAPCLTPSDAHGMRIIEAALTFRGICPQCEAELDATPPPFEAPRRARRTSGTGPGLDVGTTDFQ